MISKRDMKGRTNMKKNMNKTFALFLTLVLVMMGGMAFGQRPDNGSSNNNNVSTQHVTVGGNVFGGGNLAPVAGNSSVKLDQEDATIGTRVNGVLTEKTGDVYGGGALANVGTPGGNNTTTVDILNGIVEGSVYGGGLGDSLVINENGVKHTLYHGEQNKAAFVYGKVYVNIGDSTLNNEGEIVLLGKATIHGKVFGCNNINGTPLDSVLVNIYKTAHIESGDDINEYPTSIVTMSALEATFPQYPDDPTNQATIDYAKKFAIEAVYGGGNMASYKPLNTGNIRRCTTVHVWGCQENTIQTLYGGGNAANVGTQSKPADTRLIVDGGRFDRVFGGGNGYSSTGNHTDSVAANYNPGANIYGTASTDIYGGLYRQVFGGSNQCGDITATALTIDKHCDDLLIYESFGGANEANISGSVQTTLLCSNTEYEIHTFYGGSNKADIGGNVTLNVRGGKYTDVFGGSKGSPRPDNNPSQAQIDAASADIAGNVTLNLHGGEMVNAFGGSDVNGSIGGYITVNVWDTVNHCGLQVDTIYGGGRNARYVPDLIAGKKIISPVVNLWNGTVGHVETGTSTTVPGCVFGGGKGGGAYIAAHPKVMIGDTISSHDPNNKIVVLNGNVFGGGNAAVVDGIDSVLMLKANSEVVNLFGGGNAALADTSVVIMNVAATVDTIFGGGNLAGLNGTALVDVSAGNVRGGIYGGSNKSGTVAGDIVVNVTGNSDNYTTIGTANAAANIHGGGYGASTRTNGNVTVNFGDTPAARSEYPKVYGDIYGGSALGWVNDGNDTTMVNILNGEVKKTTSGTIVGGNIYGGGLGDKVNNIAALVNGKVFVNIGDTVVSSGTTTYRGKAVIEGDVFGCNNLNGSPQDSVFVNIFQTHHGSDYQNNLYPSTPPSGFSEWNDPAALAANAADQTYAIEAVFGGGNEAAYTPTLAGTEPRSTTVHVFNCQSNTIKDVYGGGNAADVGLSGTGNKANTFVVIDGGRINRVFGGGKGVAGSGGVAANIYGTATTTVYAGLIDSIFGGSNQNGSISIANLVIDAEGVSSCDKLYNQVFGGANVAEIEGNINTTINCGVGRIGDIYGGSNLADITGTGNVTLNIKGGIYDNVFGGSRGSSSNGANISGDVLLNLEGGTMVNAFGGSNVQGNIGGSITVNLLHNSSCDLVVDTIYGGGQRADYEPYLVGGKKIVSPVVNLLNGTVGEEDNSHVVTVAGCVFGGGKEASVTAHPKVVIGDTRSGNESYVAKVLGNVFGGGNLATVDGIDSVLMIKGNSQVVNLFGGGNMADADSTVVMMTKGIVDTIFGGGNKAGLDGTAKVALSGGTVNKGVYGGCNTSGTVEKDITVSVTGGTVGVAQVGNPGDVGYVAGQRANIHGGGYGNLTNTKGDVNLTVNGVSAVIWGDVYGGSAKGHVNDAAADKTNVTLEHGTIHGDLYGGGLGVAGTYEAKVNGAVQVTVKGGTVTGSVYGCNNAYGAPQSEVKVDIYGTDIPASGYAIGHVFGGGNAANYEGTPVVKVHNCSNKIEYVYGGGNAATVTGTDVTVYGGNSIGNVFGGCYGAAVTSGGTDVKIRGGKIGKVFGGNNQSGTINGSIKVNVNKGGDNSPGGTSEACKMYIGEVYGGGNVAGSDAGEITIGCTGTLKSNHYVYTEAIGDTLEGIGKVYGGANEANITSTKNIKLDINNGIINKVFGGNNTSGTISCGIQVNIDSTGTCSPNWYVGEVYGGGDHAYYVGTPDVNIKAGTVSGKVYGGGNDITTANMGVTNSDVEMTGGTVLGGVYGGCNLRGTVTGKSEVTIKGGTIGSQALLGAATPIPANVFGGGEGGHTKVNGDVTVTIKRAEGSSAPPAPTIYGDVYGGSAYGSVNTGSSNKTTVNILDGILKTNRSEETVNNQTIYIYNGGNVFGGGLGDVNYDTCGRVNGVITVNIGKAAGATTGLSALTEHDGNATIGGNVYGCNNTAGSPQDTVVVNIYGTAHTEGTSGNGVDGTGYAIANVFGGGNQANFVLPGKGAAVNVYGCYNTIGRVFGGGDAAATPSVETNIQGGRIGEVFGGGNGEAGPPGANVNGTVNLNIHGGNVGEFYGGSNQNGTISGQITTVVDNDGPCPDLTITEFFCGGNFVDITNDLTTTIDCSDSHITYLYGGCNQANITGNVTLNLCGGTYGYVFGGSKGRAAQAAVGEPGDPGYQPAIEAKPANITGDVTLNLYGGTIDTVFGGSNILGNILGTIFVNVLDVESTSCPLIITNIYGGSNLTNYQPTNSSLVSPIVNLVHAKYGIAGNVYGGSKGETGTTTTVKANPRVNIGYEANMTGLPATSAYNPASYSRSATIQGSVFGGGDAAKVEGNTEIYLNKHAKVIGNVYGGGNMGEVDGDTKVIINGKRQ